MIEHLLEFSQSPLRVGPYSLAVKTNSPLLFVAGQGPWDPETKRFERVSIPQQTRLTLENVRRVVEAAGGQMDHVVSCRVFLQPLTDETFAAMNEVYREYFPGDRPVRTTVGCQLLGIDVEIDCVVALEGSHS